MGVTRLGGGGGEELLHQVEKMEKPGDLLTPSTSSQQQHEPCSQGLLLLSQENNVKDRPHLAVKDHFIIPQIKTIPVCLALKKQQQHIALSRI